VIDLVSKAKALVQQRDKLDNEKETKRRRLVASSDSCDESSNFTQTISNSSVDNSNEATFGPAPPQELELLPGYNIWWDSMDAERLFNANKERERDCS
jgi:hypothetical protein